MESTKRNQHQECFVISVSIAISFSVPYHSKLSYIKAMISFWSIPFVGDEFDLHDTEDCPTQAMPTIEDQQEEAHTKSKAKRGAVREYCDNCEMFGHSNENCDAGETY